MTSRKPHHVLIIDPHLENRVVSRWMLHQAFPNGEFFEAATLDAAFECCAAAPLNCVLLNASIADFETSLTRLMETLQQYQLPLVLQASRSQWNELDCAARLGCRLVLEWESLLPRTVELTVERAIDVNSLENRLSEQSLELERLCQERLHLEESLASRDAEITALSDRLGSSGSSATGHPVELDLLATQQTLVAASPSYLQPGASRVRSVFPGSLDASSPALASDTAPRLVTRGFSAPTREEDDIARRIHRELLPPGSPLVDGYDIAGQALPASSTGGDYYDYLPMADDLISITIGECSGRGVAPAMIMASLRAYLRVLSGTSVEPSDIMSRANDLITEDIGDEEFVLTLMLLQIDQLTRTIRYSSAGHQAHLIDRDGESQVLPSTGMPLGLRMNTVIPEGISRKMRGGDVILLTTDGVQKMASPSGESFGVERMLNLVRENRELPARMIVTYLGNALREFAAGAPQTDDATIVVVKSEARTLF